MSTFLDHHHVIWLPSMLQTVTAYRSWLKKNWDKTLRVVKDGPNTTSRLPVNELAFGSGWGLCCENGSVCQKLCFKVLYKWYYQLSKLVNLFEVWLKAWRLSYNDIYTRRERRWCCGVLNHVGVGKISNWFFFPNQKTESNKHENDKMHI